VDGESLAVLDVGHGNCAVLMHSDSVIVIDAGPGTALLEYLRQQGIDAIDTVLISHADQDHIGGLVALLASRCVQIGRVRLNTDSAKGSAAWDDLLYELNKIQTTGELDFRPSLTVSDTGEFDVGRVRTEVLGPSNYLAGKGPGSFYRRGKRITANSVSAVVRVVIDDVPLALFTGDLDDIGLLDLLENGQDLSAKILIFPHHGGRSGRSNLAEFSEAICREVSPDVVVFSIGRGRHDLPRPDVVDAVRRALPNVRIACTQLSTHCATSIPTDRPTHLNPHFARGARVGHCCGGTIVVELERPDDVLPEAQTHLDFIRMSAPTALCIRSSG